MLAESDYGKKPVHVIRHGIDTTYFYPVTARRKQELRARLLGEVAGDAVVLGSAGGTDFEKGWLDLVAAVASLPRSEEHTSELQSLMRITYAVFCLKKKKK